MNARERNARLEQVNKELTRTVDDMRGMAALLRRDTHGIPPSPSQLERAHDLEAYAARVESTRDYLGEVT